MINRMKLILSITVMILFFTYSCIQKKGDSNLTIFPVLLGDYLEQEKPDSISVIFAPGVISTGYHEQNVAFSSDGKELYFTMSVPFQTYNVIMFMKKENNQWTRPRVASFSGRYSDIDPFISPDGKRLYFVSNRPMEGTGKPKENYDIWIVQRTETDWAEPENLGSTINSDKDEFYVSVTADYTIYFSSGRAGGKGSWDIYRSILVDKHYTEPENLGNSINTQFRDWDPFVAPDESYLIFASTRPGGYGGGDLYISFRNKNGSWTEAKNLGNKINSVDTEYCPNVSPDGKFFFFTRFGGRSQQFHSETQRTYDEVIKIFNDPENGLGNIYWVNTRFIDELR